MLMKFASDYVRYVLRGGTKFYAWMGALALLIVGMLYVFYLQNTEGLIVTGLTSQIHDGLYLANLVFLVGVAAGAVTIVFPAYVYHHEGMHKVTVLGEMLAISAVIMVMLFVFAHMGRPDRLWHILPGIGRFHWPVSMLTWDVLVLNGYLLINLHITRRPIWLTRHGESVFNVLGILGGDSDLSPRGEEYARNLAKFVHSQLPREANMIVWTSTMRRTIQTAQHLTRKPQAWRALDEIDAGVCDGMTYEQIEADMPDVHTARVADKFRYRYPRGESYEDVIQRLDPLILNLERQESPVLVIAHQAVLRALYAYLMDKPPSDCPKLEIPLHTVIQLTPTAYGCEEKRFPLEPYLSPAPASNHPPPL